MGAWVRACIQSRSGIPVGCEDARHSLMRRADLTLPAIVVAAGVVTAVLTSIDSSWVQMKFNRSNWVKETCSKWAGKLISDEEMIQRFQLHETVVVNGEPRATTGTAVLLCQAHGALSGL